MVTDKEEVKRIVKETLEIKLQQFLVGFTFLSVFILNLIGCIYSIPQNNLFVVVIMMINAIIFGLLFFLVLDCKMEENRWNGL